MKKSKIEKSQIEKSQILSVKVLSLVLLFSGCLLYAGVIEANKYGILINSGSARDLSMGDCWVTSYFNTNTHAVEGLNLQYSPSLNFPTEGRSEFIFDEYDNTVGKQTTAYNTNHFLDYPFTARLSYTKKPLYISLGWEPVIDGHWKFEDIERDDFYQITKREMRERSILINSLALRCGWEVAAVQSGIFIKWLSGTLKDYYQIDTSKFEFYEKGSGYEIGGVLNYEFNWRLKAVLKGSLGQRFNTPINDYEYPYRLGAGLIFKPVNKLPAVATVEVIYTPWERLKVNNLTGEDLVNTVSVSAGIEHRLKPGLYLRFGYRWEPTYIDKEITRSKITYGLGYEHWGFKFDIAGSFSTNSFTYDEIQLDDIGEYEILEESETLLILTVSKMFEVK